LLDRLGRWLAKRYSLKDPALARLFGGGGATLAGPIVNEVTAFTCAAFYDGVNQLSSDIAKLPLNLHKRIKGVGGSEVKTDDAKHRMMRYAPNPETTSLEFRRTVTMHALVYGNGYAEIVRDGIGRPRALWPLHPQRVQPFYPDGSEPGAPSGVRGELRYRIDGGPTVLGGQDMFHLRSLSDDGATGINLVAVAREALGLCLASQQFAASFFGHGTRFGGVLKNDMNMVSEEQAKDVMHRVEALHAKADQAFRMLVIGSDWTFHETGTSPTDAQMTELRDQQVTEVARFLNMPLYKLKLNTPGAVSYASVEMASLDYYKGPILTWVTSWEEELTKKLIHSSEWGIEFWKHNVAGFLRGDMKSRADALTTYRAHGVISANEIRDLEDMNPQGGTQGDQYLVQGAMVPADRMDDIIDAQVAPPPAPVVAAPDEPEPDDEPDDDDEPAPRNIPLRDAHHELLAGVAERLARIDRDAVKRRQTNRDKLREWFPGYVETKLPVYTEAFMPVVRALLAGDGGAPSSVDVRSHAELVASRHLGTLGESLSPALESDDCAAVAERAIDTWERERPYAVVAEIEADDRICDDPVERRPDPVSAA